MSLWKNTKFSWDKWNCRKIYFYRIILFLISQNLPFGCHFIYRKTLQLIACVLYYLRANPGKANNFKYFQIWKTKESEIAICYCWNSSRKWVSVPYTITDQSVSLGDPFSCSSFLINKELTYFQIWVLIRITYHRISASVVLIASWTVFLWACAHAKL